MEISGIEQRLQHDGDTTDPIEVDHVVLAERLHVSNVWDPARYLIEVLKCELDLSLIGDREQMKHRVR